MAANGWYSNIGKGVTAFKDLVQAWVDGTATDTRGVIIQVPAGAYLVHWLASSEYATDSLRPKLTIEYTAADTTPPVLATGVNPATLSYDTTATTVDIADVGTCTDAGSGMHATQPYQVSYSDVGISADTSCSGKSYTITTAWGTSHAASFTGTDGHYYCIKLECKDAAGTPNSTAYYSANNIKYDITPPVQSSHSPADSSTITDATQDITFTLDEAGDCYLSVTNDYSYADMVTNIQTDCDGDGTTSISCTTPDLGEDGAKTVYIACQDTLFNGDTDATNTDLGYTLDTTPPVQSAHDPANAATITDTTQDITFTTDENATCYLSLDGDEAYADMSDDTLCTGGGTTSQSCTTPDLGADGAKTVYLACTDGTNADTAGTNTALTYTLLTNTAPTLTSIADSPDPIKGSTTITITPTGQGDADTDALYFFCDESGTPTSGSNLCSQGDATYSSDYSSMTCTYTVDTGDTTRTVYCRTYDGTDYSTERTTTYTVDTTGPTLSFTDDVAAGPVQSDTITPSWGDATTKLWDYDADGTCSTSSGDYSKTDSDSMDQSTQTNNTKYICMYAEDSVANYSTQASANDINIDASTPTQSAHNPASGTTISDTTPTIALTLNENGDCFASTTDESYDAMSDNDDCTGDGTTSISCTLSDLGADGAKNVYIACEDTLGNKDDAGTNTALSYTLDTTAPTFTMQYYYDSSLANSIADNAVLGAGTYYVKVSADEALGSAPTVSISAEGTANDVIDGATTLVSGNNYKYTRTISSDVSAVGSVLEDWFVSGSDSAGNPATDVSPTNEATKSVYTDTVSPQLTITSPSDSGSYGASVDFDASASDTNIASLISDLDDSLIGWWRMEDNAGNTTVTDYMGNYNGTAQQNTSSLHTAGHNVSALTFNGSSDYISMPSYDFGDNFTISLWMKPTDTSQILTFASNANSGSGSYGFRFYVNYWNTNNRVIYFESAGPSTSGWTQTDGAAVTFGNWSFVTLTVDRAGGDAHIFVNGTDVTDPTSTASTNFTTSTTWNIGKMKDGFPFKGSIDDVMIFNRILTSDEVTAIYNGTAIAHSSTDLADGSHTYKSYAQDQAGNIGVSATNTFSSDATPPVQSAHDPSSGSTISDTTPTITLTLDEAGDCRASTTDESYDAMSDNDDCTGDGTTSISCTLSDLGVDGAKNVYISCQDSYSNKYTTGTNTELTYTLDTTGPTNVGISTVTADSTTQLTVTANTATDAGAGLHATPYQIQETTGNDGATSSAYQASTTHIDTGLSPNTLYTYKVRAKDILDNVSDYSAESSVYTLANVPTNLAVTVDSSTQITSTWEANSNPAGTEYYIENVTGSTNSDWITDLTWSSSGLICNTQYTFQVKARNTDLTETAYADTITATTSACASQITGGGASGTALSFLKPTPPLNGFMLQINSGALSSASQDVTLFIRGSTTTPRMSISNDPSFTNAVQESYNITKQWRLTDIQGPKTVYLKFFTNYGVPSDIITATIYYQKPNILTPIINIFNPQTPENPPGIPPIPPQPPVEETVTQQAPLSLQNIWNLLPTQAINQFVLSPVPQEIRDLAAKFPGLANTLQ